MKTVRVNARSPHPALRVVVRRSPLPSGRGDGGEGLGRSTGWLVPTLLVAALLGLLAPARADLSAPHRNAPPLPTLDDRPPGATAEETGPSPVIFPLQRVPLNFDHRKHARLSCVSCHARAESSRVSTDDLLPAPGVCDACHGSDHRELSSVKSQTQPPNCGFCHAGYRPQHGNRVERVVLPSPNLRFDHHAHAARRIGCGQCHGEVQNVGLATRDQLPRMRACLGCHQMTGPSRGDARGDCDVCHLMENNRLKTTFSTGSLLPPSWLHNSEHGAGWSERHKIVAAADSAFCATCHKESECVECHDGKVRPLPIHPNDWLSLHAQAARQDNPRCSSCHRGQTFCLTCHERAGVTWAAPLGNAATRGRFHPPASVWTDPPRTAQHHAWEAERNLTACTSCHTERDCAVCHATAARGGVGARPADRARGLNPHPPGFSSACRGILAKNERPCLFCHAEGDPLLDRCR